MSKLRFTIFKKNVVLSEKVVILWHLWLEIIIFNEKRILQIFEICKILQQQFKTIFFNKRFLQNLEQNIFKNTFI